MHAWLAQAPDGQGTQLYRPTSHKNLVFLPAIQPAIREMITRDYARRFEAFDGVLLL
jgi:hypothetical protein